MKHLIIILILGATGVALYWSSTSSDTNGDGVVENSIPKDQTPINTDIVTASAESTPAAIAQPSADTLATTTDSNFTQSTTSSNHLYADVLNSIDEPYSPVASSNPSTSNSKSSATMQTFRNIIHIMDEK